MPLSGMPWMYGQGAQSPQRQRFQVPDVAGTQVMGVGQMLGADEALMQYAAQRREEEERERQQEEIRKQQDQARRAATGAVLGGALGGIAGASTSLIPVAGPFIAPVATPALALAGSKIGEKVAGGQPELSAMDVIPVAEGAIRGGNAYQRKQLFDQQQQNRIDSAAREAAFMQNLHPSLLEAYANAPDRIVGQVQAGDYAEFNDRFVPYWERRGAA